MTVQLEPVKSYERLDFFIDLINNKLEDTVTTVKQYMDSYFKTASELGVSEDDAKRYLKERIASSTYYKYLPEYIERKATRPKKIPPVESSEEDNEETINIPTEYKVQVNCPTEPTIEEEFGKGVVEVPKEDFLHAKSQEENKDKTISELKGLLTDKDKRIDEMARQMKAILAAHPEDQKNPLAQEVVKALQHKIEDQLLEIEELRARVKKPAEFKSGADMLNEIKSFKLYFASEQDKFTLFADLRKIQTPNGYVEFYLDDENKVKNWSVYKFGSVTAQ